MEVISWCCLYEVRRVELQGKMNCKFLADAGFVCNRAPMVATVPRDSSNCTCIYVLWCKPALVTLCMIPVLTLSRRTTYIYICHTVSLLNSWMATKVAGGGFNSGVIGLIIVSMIETFHDCCTLIVIVFVNY